MADFHAIRGHGCVAVDTTCGSVLNVWKRVESYARDGFTSLLHGKHYHEETRATASRALSHPGGHYLVVRDLGEADAVIAYMERVAAGTTDANARGDFQAMFGHAASPGFDPDRDLRRIGVANQTTMLAKESLEIGQRVGAAVERLYGEAYREANFRTFDTICSATQDRQDAVKELLQEPLDAMIVVGGFNSSNTISLAALCAERVPTYHIEDAESIDVPGGTLVYRPAGVKHSEAVATQWLRDRGAVVIGITAGASTPNNKIGDTIARVLAMRGLVLS
jgi:4-hydroxy-3-methylbut-2-enyl diphosphate reductase